MANKIWKEVFLIMCSSSRKNARNTERFSLSLRITDDYALQTLCGEQHKICNADGKALGLPMNRPLLDKDYLPYDIIRGTFFVAGLGQEDFISLTDEQIQRYKSLYDNMQILPVRTAAGEQGRIVGDQHIKKKGKIDHER